MHHHIAPFSLARRHLIWGELEEYSHFRGGNRLGSAPPVAVAEHHLVVECPFDEHGAVDENHHSIDTQILKHVGNAQLAILQSPGRSDAEITQPDKDDMPHQIEISDPKQKPENRVQ